MKNNNRIESECENKSLGYQFKIFIIKLIFINYEIDDREKESRKCSARR